MNPYDTAHQLADAIRSTEQYQAMQEARSRIEQDQTALRMIQDYRKRQWDMQAKQVQGQKLTEEERKTFERLTEVVAMNQDIKHYLELEMYWNNVLMDMYGILTGALEEVLLPHPWESVAED